MRHELKTDPGVFGAVADGTKTYEIRKNDRAFCVGDTLVLKETRHSGAEMAAGAPLLYTGRQVVRHVSHALYGPIYGLADGWAILSLAQPRRSRSSEVLGPNVENEMTVMSNEDPALPDDLPVLDACMTCLSDDAALLHSKNSEDEVADNMLKAEELMREMAGLLAAVLGSFTRDDDLPDNLLQRIHAVLYRT